jgi:PAS domain S-box-containing protein
MIQNTLEAYQIVDGLMTLALLGLAWICLQFSGQIGMTISHFKAQLFKLALTFVFLLQALLLFGSVNASVNLAIVIKVISTALLLFLGVFIWLSLKSNSQQKSNQPLTIENSALCPAALASPESPQYSLGLSAFILDELTCGILVIDQNLQIVACNRTVCDIFGYTQAQLINSPLSLLIASDKAMHHDLLMDKFFQSPSQHQAIGAERIVAGITNEGEEVHLHIELSTVSYYAKSFAIASVTQVDKTLDDQKLHFELSNRLRRAIDASNDGIWEWNPKTEKAWCNLSCKTLTSHPEGVEPDLKYWWEHIHPEDLDLIKVKLKEHSSHNLPLDIIYRGRDSNNQYRWLHLRGNTVYDKRRKPLLTSGTLTDIDKVKRLEQTLAGKSQFLEAVIDKSLCGIYRKMFLLTAVILKLLDLL